MTLRRPMRCMAIDSATVIATGQSPREWPTPRAPRRAARSRPARRRAAYSRPAISAISTMVTMATSRVKRRMATTERRRHVGPLEAGGERPEHGGRRDGDDHAAALPRCTIVPACSMVGRSPSAASAATAAPAAFSTGIDSLVSRLSSTSRPRRLDQPDIGRHLVAGVELHDVAGDQQLAVDTAERPSAPDGDGRMDERFQRAGPRFGPPFLEGADGGIARQHDEDEDGVAGMAERERRAPAAASSR